MQSGLVIIPTYNEIENIVAITQAVLQLPDAFHLLIVDDNSPDGTAGKVRELQLDYPGRLFLEVREKKSGLGTAYVHGFRWALQKAYPLVFEMDADFSHNPKDLPLLGSACNKGADMAIGSRYVKGVNVVNWPLSRILLSYFASRYVRLITGMPVQDATSGFVCYRAEVLQAINLDKIRFVGYAFQIEMKYRVYSLGYRLQEIPIIFTDRVLGKSKMSGRIIREAVFGVLNLRLKKMLNRL